MDKDKLSAAAAVVIALALVIALLGSWKKDIHHAAMEAALEEIDIDDIIIFEEVMELPEIEAQEALLPEILPPLYEEPLPPLQGEV